MATYVYMRHSTDQQTDDRQREVISKYLEQHPDVGPVAEYFVDRATTGKTTLFDRPGGRKMIETIRPDDVILVSDVDRLGRRSIFDLVATLNQLNTVYKVKMRIVNFPLSGGLDTETPIGQLILCVMAFMANIEREMICARVKAGKEAKRRLGRLRTNLKAGYKYVKRGGMEVIVADPYEQRIMERIRRMRIQGKTFGQIYFQLRKEKIFRRGGKKEWSCRMIKAICGRELWIRNHPAKYGHVHAPHLLPLAPDVATPDSSACTPPAAESSPETGAGCPPESP